MALAETLEVGHQPALAEGRLGGNAQHLGFAAVAEDVAAGHVQLHQDLVHLGQVQGAGRGQVQAPADTLEQRVRKHLFKLRDLLAHRALGQVQLLRGAGKAQVPGGGFEALQGGGGGHQAFGHGRDQPGEKEIRSFRYGIMCF
ncbi:hypothetical protein D3C80_1479030 [compost metagenome]